VGDRGRPGETGGDRGRPGETEGNPEREDSTRMRLSVRDREEEKEMPDLYSYI
jgi:hypothetical protein